jgi:cytochrome b561
MAVMILTMIGVGIYMTSIDKVDPLRPQLYALHKATGVTVLALAVIRILWILTSRPPLLPSVLRRWEVILAKATTGLLYLLMLMTPIVGYLMSNAAGRSISYFGLFDLPTVIGEHQELREVLGELHGLLAFSILALVGLHAAGALKHRLIDKDPEADVLKRML